MKSYANYLEAKGLDTGAHAAIQPQGELVHQSERQRNVAPTAGTLASPKPDFVPHDRSNWLAEQNYALGD